MNSILNEAFTGHSETAVSIQQLVTASLQDTEVRGWMQRWLLLFSDGLRAETLIRLYPRLVKCGVKIPKTDK